MENSTDMSFARSSMRIKTGEMVWFERERMGRYGISVQYTNLFAVD